MAVAVQRQAFRSDIQGLRAIAVGLVVLYHAHVPGISGGFVGVDVFFVISGFLISNHLLASLDQNARIGFATFYAKRARRILPAAVVVVVLTVVASFLWLPRLLWEGTLEDAAATVLYVPNVWFAQSGTDYLAAETPSVFQHYWSLGIEEQFYLVWPLVLVALFRAARGSKRALAAAVVVLVVTSFVACVLLTEVSQPWAFFSLPTRAWELGTGALVAILVSVVSWRPSRAVATGGTGLGLLLIAGGAVFYSDQTVFPGYAALLPVAGTALAIYFGGHPTFATGALLGLRPVVFIGTISYSLYLVHWPVLVIPEQAGGTGEGLPMVASAVLALACVPLSYLLYRFVEKPAQRSPAFTARRPRFTLLIVGGVTCAMAVVAVVGTYAARLVPLDAGMRASAVALEGPPRFTSFVPSNLAPSLVDASGDNPSIYREGCHAEFLVTEPIGCEFGSDDAPFTVALFGDSHAAQWFPALKTWIDNDDDMRLRVDTKSSCPSVDMPKYVNNVLYQQCGEWRASVIAELAANPPDLVIISNRSRSGGFHIDDDQLSQRWAEATESTVRQIQQIAPTVVIADTPEFPSTPSVCLSAHLEDTRPCSLDRDVALDAALIAAERGAVLDSGGEYVNMNDLLCSDELCGPIVGNRLIYRDSHHLTASASKDLGPELRTATQEGGRRE